MSEIAAQNTFSPAPLWFRRGQGETDVDGMATQDSQAFPVQVVKVSSELLSSKCIDKGI